MIVDLTQGQCAVIDDTDLLLVEGRSWYAHRIVMKSGIRWYAETEINGKTLLMHRRLLGLGQSDPDVDHVDGDGLNNRRGNLRLATRSQNCANADGHPTRRKSKYKGVRWRSDTRYRAAGYWLAILGIDGRRVQRTARTELEAAQIYNELASQHFGEYARMNALEIT